MVTRAKHKLYPMKVPADGHKKKQEIGYDWGSQRMYSASKADLDPGSELLLTDPTLRLVAETHDLDIAESTSGFWN